MRIGEEGLGEFAREQIEAARKDPRGDRGRGAMVADFWLAVQEAERVRMLAISGAHELTHALEREEASLSASRDDADLQQDVAARLQAAWGRAELARLEIANDHPLLNAQTLLSLNGALDAMVEEFAPAMRKIGIFGLTEHVMGIAEKKVPEASEELTPERRQVLKDVLGDLLGERVLPGIERLRGSGAARYEVVLGSVGLAAPADRPVPGDLDEALAELGALRDVLTHRAGRMDQKALDQAPSLPYKDGELVRISRVDYRRYSAAIRCYAAEIIFRSIRNWPEVTDENVGPRLSDWRNHHLINA